MNETEFTHKLKEKLTEILPASYTVQAFANLYYQLTINNKLELEEDITTGCSIIIRVKNTGKK